MATILVIEDDPTIRPVIEFALTKAGYSVSTASTGTTGLKTAQTIGPDLILLDIMLPGLSGFEVATTIRATDKVTPIIMLTALDREENKVRGLDAGADDYITKPFSTSELLARIRANMRRAQAKAPQPTGTLSYGDLRIDVDAAQVYVADKPVHLRAKEYELLLTLASRPGALSTRTWLATEVWGEEFLPTSRTIDVHIRRIRKAVEDPSAYRFIHTVHGMGYRFQLMDKDDREITDGMEYGASIS